MKNLPLDHYPPLARKAVIFLNVAKTLNETTNRTVGSEEVEFYLVSHAIELSIKALAVEQTGQAAERIHDKEVLAEKYREICGFSEEELKTIRILKDLHDGPGGLRYDNTPRGHFLPSTFEKGVKVVERLLEKFE